MKLRFWRILLSIVIIIAALLIVGLGYQTSAAAIDRRNYPPRGELIDMGGYDLHLHCEGSGSPTVILIAGAGNIGAIWELVQNGLRAETRVCSYDRPGLGWSDYTPDADLTIGLQMEILRRLLQTAGENGPYIVVGHSVGGVLARTFAAQYPAETVGLVLVDSSIEGQFSSLPAENLAGVQTAGEGFKALRIVAPFGLIRLLELGRIVNAESFEELSADAQAAIVTTFHQTRHIAALQRDWAVSEEVLLTGTPFEPLGDVPLIVISRDPAALEAGPETEAIWYELQAGLNDLSTNSTWIIAENSGHFIHTHEPEIVVEAVKTLLVAD